MLSTGSARYTMVGYLTFTPTPPLCPATDKRAFSVVDGRAAAHRYESIWNPPGAQLLFDYRDRFHYLAVKEGEAFLVEEKIE